MEADKIYDLGVAGEHFYDEIVTALRSAHNAVTSANVTLADVEGRLRAKEFVDRGPIDGRVHLHSFTDHLSAELLERLWPYGRADVAGAHGRRARLYLAAKAAEGDGFDCLIDGKTVVQGVILHALAEARGPLTFLQLSLRLHLRTAEGVHLKPDVDVVRNNLERLVGASKLKPGRRGGHPTWTLTNDTAAEMGVLGPERAPYGLRSH